MSTRVSNDVQHHVAVTSTLPVFGIGVPGRPSIPQRVLDALSLTEAVTRLSDRADPVPDEIWDGPCGTTTSRSLRP